MLPRKMSDIKEYLDGKNKLLKPYFADFGGTVKKHPTMKKTWIISGQCDFDDKNMIIHIGDLPPLIRFDNFLKKLYLKMDELGDDGKLDNDSSKRVNLTIRWKNKSTWDELKMMVDNLTTIGAIESLIFVKDGAIVEYEDFSDYLDEFKIHRERVFYKKMLFDSEVTSDELDFLYAKVDFLKYMMEKKRTSDEVKTWLKPFKPKIRSRLDSIRLTVLTLEEIKATQELIKITIKQLEAEKKIVKTQLEKCSLLEKSFIGKSKINVGARSLFEEDKPITIDGIDIYQIEDENEEDENEELEELTV